VQGDWQRPVGSQGDQPGQFDQPWGLALTPDEELLLVADEGNCRVAVLRALDGAWVRQLTGPPGTLEGPASVAVVPSTGEVLVSDFRRDRVFRFCLDDGTVFGTLGTGQGSGPTEFSSPKGLAVLDGSQCPLVCFLFAFLIIVSESSLMLPLFVIDLISGKPRGRCGRFQQPSVGPVAPGRRHRVEATGIARHEAGAVFLALGRGGDEYWGAGGH
jgi:DNA-binding beta-propeller fold protein YncE